jgi:two-component system cell cycle sensor histidine kinase/response regulator CckA
MPTHIEKPKRCSIAFADIPNETSPARLLVVEDDVLVASSLDELLNASGFDVVGIAGSAATAASLADEWHPQLALIDIRLVGPIDRIELACHFREQFRIPTISYPASQIRRRKNAPF